MNINRHNYEEFFLLYVDNELSEKQRAEVETFVQQNHDLAEELNMLMQATLLPEPSLTFEDKNTLYKKGSGIDLANCEEYFLLHLDNELSNNEKEEVEKFVLQHPQTQEAFTLLHQTKLPPENITFENKAVLYRTEQRRIVPVRWMRVAVAAAVIGLVALLWFTNADNNISVPGDQGVAVQTPSNDSTPGKTIQPTVGTNNDEKQVAVNDQPQPKVNQVEVKNASAAGDNKIKPAINTPTHQSTTTAKNTVAGKPEAKPEMQTNNLPERIINNDVIAGNDKVKPEDYVITSKPDQRTNPSRNNATENTTNALTAASKNEEDNNLAKHTVYREVDLNNEEEDNSFLIGSAQINKNKLRGLFKKASTLIDKLSNKKENK